MELAQLDQKRIAVLLRLGERRRILRGNSSCEVQPGNRRVLKIQLDARPGQHPTYLLLPEEVCQLAVRDGARWGCDFRIDLATSCSGHA